MVLFSILFFIAISQQIINGKENECDNEKLNSPKQGHGRMSINGKMKDYVLQDGLYVVEGDIVVGKKDDDLRRRLIPITTNGVWSNGYIPYVINVALSSTLQSRIADAISHWESETDIQFGARNGETDFVQFTTGTGCASYVGRIGGKQYIYLADGCTTGNTIHEIGHTIGFWHTHTREDRDSYITVYYENIEDDAEFNFDKHIDDADDCLAYDYGSIMHYSRTGFSKNGEDTIVPVQSGVTIGQRDGLSAIDIACSYALYEQDEGYLKTAIGSTTWCLAEGSHWGKSHSLGSNEKNIFWSSSMTDCINIDMKFDGVSSGNNSPYGTYLFVASYTSFETENKMYLQWDGSKGDGHEIMSNERNLKGDISQQSDQFYVIDGKYVCTWAQGQECCVQWDMQTSNLYRVKKKVGSVVFGMWRTGKEAKLDCTGGRDPVFFSNTL